MKTTDFERLSGGDSRCKFFLVQLKSWLQKVRQLKRWVLVSVVLCVTV